MVWHTGKKLNGGQYTVERVLGQGGFGITYLAKNTNLGMGKMNLEDQFYYDEFITSIIIIGASLLGIGLGWLMFAYI
jgi:serine/threonine protein kinase